MAGQISTLTKENSLLEEEVNSGAQRIKDLLQVLPLLTLSGLSFFIFVFSSCFCVKERESEVTEEMENTEAAGSEADLDPAAEDTALRQRLSSVGRRRTLSRASSLQRGASLTRSSTLSRQSSTSSYSKFVSK